MKWAKYSVFLLLSFCLFFGLSPLKQVNAATKPLRDYANIVIINNNGGNFFNVICSDGDITSEDIGNGVFSMSFSNNRYGIAQYQTTNIDEVIAYVNNSWINSDFSDSAYGSINYISPISIIKGSISGVYPGQTDPDDPDDPEDPDDPGEQTWWDKVKEAFMDFVGSEALSDVLSGSWISYIDDVLFGELWTVKVGEGEDELAQELIPQTVSATPSPSPTPLPTPIPYSTVINPSTGEVTYNYYINVSGTPVPTSSIYPPVTSTPPGPGSGSTIDEPVTVEDYYEPEDSLSIPKLRIFKFLLRMTGNDVDVGMDSLDNNIAVMDETLEDNAEAIQGVGDLFQIIPVKWFLLIGTIACFPVIAAMIKSLLGG